MSEGHAAPGLQAFDEGYEILGELRSGDLARTYLARRRSDGLDVVIAVARAPSTGENNALNHFAADTQLLAKLDHADLPEVLEGKWVGKDEFAVVSRRYQADTLAELLARGKKFSPPEIAEILQKVDSVLDWARTSGVVHRGVTPDTVMFERGTNRVLVSLMPTPIPIEGIPDAASDARTIGMLAATMFTGAPYAGVTSLAELRPDLAARVSSATDALVHLRIGEPADVAGFVAVVAAADALKAGELEIAELEAQLLEERRTERLRLESEQRAFVERNTELEAQLAREREDFKRQMTAEEEQLAAVKTNLAQLRAHEESQMNAERAQLDQERREFDQRMAELRAAEAALASRQSEIERLRAEEGKRIDAAIASAVETVAATAAVEPPPEAAIYDTVQMHTVGVGEPVVVPRGERRRRRRWVMPALATTFLALLIAATVVVAHMNRSPSDVVAIGKSKIVATPPVTDSGNLPRGGFLTQSAGGAIEPSVGPPVAAPGNAPPDSTNPATGAVPGAAGGATPTDSAAAAAARLAARPKPATSASRDTSGDATALSPGERSAFAAEAGAIARAERARRDSIARRDSVARRNSQARRDSLARRDSTRARRDSLATPPDTDRVRSRR